VRTVHAGEGEAALVAGEEIVTIAIALVRGTRGCLTAIRIITIAVVTTCCVVRALHTNSRFLETQLAQLAAVLVAFAVQPALARVATPIVFAVVVAQALDTVSTSFVAHFVVVAVEARFADDDRLTSASATKRLVTTIFISRAFDANTTPGVAESVAVSAVLVTLAEIVRGNGVRILAVVASVVRPTRSILSTLGFRGGAAHFAPVSAMTSQRRQGRVF
jgi:hypothetical protein